MATDIIRDRLPILQSIPTLAERTGNFSELPAAAVIYDPKIADLRRRNLFADAVRGKHHSRRPPSRRSRNRSHPIFPTPTNSNIQNNYLASLPIQVNTYNMTGKVDVNLSDRHRLFGFFADGHYATNFTGSLNQTGVGVLPEPYTQGRIVEESVKMAQLHDTFTITPTLLNQFSYSFNRIWIPLQNPTTGGQLSAEGRAQGLAAERGAATFPDINFTGTNSPGGWQGTNAHFFNEAANTFTAQDNVMWVKGRHSMVFGFQYQALQDNENFALTAIFNFNSSADRRVTMPRDRWWPPPAMLTPVTCWARVNSSSVNQNAIGETGGRYKDLRRLYSGRFQSQLAPDPEPRPALGSVGSVLRSQQPDVVLQPESAESGRGRPSGRAPVCRQRPRQLQLHALPSTLTTRISALAWEPPTASTTRPSCGPAFAMMYVHAGGVGGRNNSRQGLSQLGFNATNTRTAPATTLRRITGTTAFLPSPRRRRSSIPVTGLASSLRIPRACRTPSTATRSSAASRLITRTGTSACSAPSPRT